MPRRRLRGVRTRGPRRKVSWEFAFVTANDLLLNDGDKAAFWVRVPAGAVDTNTVHGIDEVIVPDATLVRTRHFIEHNSNNGGAQANQPWLSGSGIIAWDGLTDDPADLGDNLPHPIYDGELDWLYLNIGNSVVANIAASSNGGGDVDAYQSRAMRKLSNGTGLLWVFGYADPLGIVGNLSFDIAMHTRMLVKLP